MLDGEAEHREFFGPVAIPMQHAELRVGQLDEVILTLPLALCLSIEAVKLTVARQEEPSVKDVERRVKPRAEVHDSIGVGLFVWQEETLLRQASQQVCRVRAAPVRLELLRRRQPERVGIDKRVKVLGAPRSRSDDLVNPQAVRNPQPVPSVHVGLRRDSRAVGCAMGWAEAHSNGTSTGLADSAARRTHARRMPRR